MFFKLFLKPGHTQLIFYTKNPQLLKSWRVLAKGPVPLCRSCYVLNHGSPRPCRSATSCGTWRSVANRGKKRHVLVILAQLRFITFAVWLNTFPIRKATCSPRMTTIVTSVVRSTTFTLRKRYVYTMDDGDRTTFLLRMAMNGHGWSRPRYDHHVRLRSVTV